MQREQGSDEERTGVLSAAFAAKRAMLVRRWLPDGGGSPGRKRWRWFAVVAAVATGLVVLGVVRFVGAEPRAETAPALPAAVSSTSASSAPSSAPAGRVVVSVVGKVPHPGLVRLAEGARVADAIAAAGGPVSGVDVSKINLARRLGDGEQLFVGIPTPAWARQPAPAPAGSGSGSGTGSTAGAGGGQGRAGASAKINLNSATAEQLDTLPGVGEVTAKKILDWRTKHGRFATVEQLQDVDGIGDKKLAKLRDKVTVQ